MKKYEINLSFKKTNRDKLLEEINLLRQELAIWHEKVIYQKTQRYNHVESLLYQNFGYYWLKIARLDFEYRKIVRKVQLMQIAINNDEEIDFEGIEFVIECETETYLKDIENYEEKLLKSEEYKRFGMLSEEDSRKIKKLFVEIMKKIHPDVNKTVDPKLFELAIEAYKNGDYSGLMNIKLLSESYSEEDLSNLEIKQLEDKVEELQKQLEEINAIHEKISCQYPYDLLFLLDDVDLHIQNYQAKIKDYEERIEYYKKKEKELISKNEERFREN